MIGINTNIELDIFKSNLTAKPYCRNFKNEPVRVLPKAAAIKYNNIQADHPEWQNYFVVDIDTNWMTVLDNTNLRPNLLVSNKDNLKAHLFFRIEALSKTKYSRIKPIRYASSIEKSLCYHLSGDEQFNNQTAKNPLKTDVFNVLSFRQTPFSFSELHDHLDLSKRAQTREINGLSRNCDMFDIVRYRAYQVVENFKSNGDFNSFFNDLMDYAISKNNFSNPLAPNELKNIIQSVANWTFKNYDGSGKGVKRGRDKLAFLDNLGDKQTYAAIKTNKQRKEATERKIRGAIYSLKADGYKITQKAVAERSGVTARTIREYKKFIQDIG